MRTGSSLRQPRSWAVVVTVTAFTLGLLITPAQSTTSHAATSAAPTAQECATTLNCSVTEIEQLDIPERLVFVRAMENGPGQEIESGFDRWRNIEGVLEFFRAHDWGNPGTWASTVDAAILAGTEHGLAIALGRTSGSFEHPGAGKWASYLKQLRSGAFSDRAAHDKAWGEAEQASTDWGGTLARRADREPSRVQHRWFELTQQYRSVLRKRPAAFDLITTHGPRIDPTLAKFKVPFYDWATDVSNKTPARHGAEAFYNFARLHALPASLDAADVFVSYLPAAYREFRVETGLD